MAGHTQERVVGIAKERRMRSLVILFVVGISVGATRISARADIAPFYVCANRGLSSSAIYPSRNSKPADFEREARSDVTLARKWDACLKETVGDPAPDGERVFEINKADFYSLAADLYRCAGDTSLAAAFERKTKAFLAAAEPPQTDKEAREFKLTLQQAGPAPNGGCWEKL